MLNRCQIDSTSGGEGEADSRMRSGGSVPNKPLTSSGCLLKTFGAPKGGGLNQGSQSGFCAIFFGLRLKGARSYGVAREKRKQSEEKQRKLFFSPIFWAEFLCEFSMHVFRSENGKRLRKTEIQHKNPAPPNDSIKNADQVVLQTQPMCLCEQRKGTSKKEFFFNSQLCNPLPTKNF